MRVEDGVGRPVEIEADATVLVTQRLSDDALYLDLTADPDALAEAGIDAVHRVGDCVAPRLIADAIFDGHRLAREIDAPDPARARCPTCASAPSSAREPPAPVADGSSGTQSRIWRVATQNPLPTWRYEEGGTKGSWEGHDAGGSDVSGLHGRRRGGRGPAAHTHPYSETFIVLEGRGRFRYGDGHMEAKAGEILVVPPNTMHGFKGVGPGRLRMVTIHAAPAMETTWLEEDDGGEVS